MNNTTKRKQPLCELQNNYENGPEKKVKTFDEQNQVNMENAPSQKWVLRKSTQNSSQIKQTIFDKIASNTWIKKFSYMVFGQRRRLFSFELKQSFPNVSPDTLFNAWLDPRIHTDITKGYKTIISSRQNDNFSLYNQQITGKNIRIDKKNKEIKQSWRTLDFDPEQQDSVVTLKFTKKPSENKTILNIKQQFVEEEHYKRLQEGWKTLYFNNIASYFCPPIYAICKLSNRNGADGVIRFKQEKNKTRIQVEVGGCPKGIYGLFFHQNGDISNGLMTMGPKYHIEDTRYNKKKEEPHYELNNTNNYICFDEKSDYFLSMQGNNSIIGKSICLQQKISDWNEDVSTPTPGAIEAFKIFGKIERSQQFSF